MADESNILCDGLLCNLAERRAFNAPTTALGINVHIYRVGRDGNLRRPGNVGKEQEQ